MEIIGTVQKILDLQIYKNNFKKRELLIKTEEQYPQILIIEFILEKTKLLNSLKKDDKIKLFINLKGKKWTTKTGETRFFNSIQGWKIETMTTMTETDRDKTRDKKTETDKTKKEKKRNRNKKPKKPKKPKQEKKPKKEFDELPF
ncbi:DUF3127 domain-containing protein [Candidatus Karelsulcia muelleri]